NSEAIPEDLIRWTEGRALVATGSPFAPVSYGGATFQTAQCNNVFVFPAVGLGLVASRARRVTDGMMIVAARTLARHSPTAVDPTCSLLPAVADLREVALEIALAVGLEAQNAGVAPQTSREELRERVKAARWDPVYPELVE
ncbi:MAG TPA: malic enzyme-like NAD(P)-binding protein, partial [Candidatus Limnocylindrales bacterium]|nr:malic enzyme-like NAD(P)-binding protein [Candidatus Limnocylindrales bacterium]